VWDFGEWQRVLFPLAGIEVLGSTESNTGVSPKLIVTQVIKNYRSRSVPQNDFMTSWRDKTAERQTDSEIT